MSTNKHAEDATGRSRLAHNLIVSWLSYIVFVISGFIMPRLISDNLGQEILGIWDFCWSFVSYLGHAGLGVGSSASRHMAKYLAEKEFDKLRGIYSTAFTIQLTLSALFLSLTILFYFYLPSWFGASMGEHVHTAQLIVLFLGGSATIEFAFDTSRGLMTASHRWDIHNIINSVSRGVAVLGMVILLFLDGDIVDLAIVYFGVVALTEIIRFFLARRICTHAYYQNDLVTKQRVKQLYAFGIKSAVAQIPSWAIVQTNAIFVAQVLGPAALAIVARPIALIKHIERFINKFTFMLTPTAASMKGTKDLKEIRSFFIATTKYNVAFTTPLVITLMILGDHVMRLWMGDAYVNTHLVVSLSAGFWLIISQSTVIRILIGMYWHGKIGFINLFTSFGIFAILAAYFQLTGTFTIEKSAYLVTIPLIVTTGFFTPLYACHRLELNYFEYLVKSFGRPSMLNLLAATPVLLVLYYSETLSGAKLALLLIPYYVLLAILYWMLLLESYQRRKILTKIPIIKNKLKKEQNA